MTIAGLIQRVMHLRLSRWIINQRQRRYVRAHLAGRNRIIVFIVPGYDTVNGGLLAIIGHAAETNRLAGVHQAAVAFCSMPGQPDLMHYTRFTNEATILALFVLLEELKPGTRVHLNLPEVYVAGFNSAGLAVLGRHADLRFSFNVMLQNIDLAPDEPSVAQLVRLGPVTITTAHRAYANASTEKLLRAPVHHWSVAVSPEKYFRQPYGLKETLFVVSPDKNPRRENSLALLKSALPDYEFIVIWNMTFEEYKAVIARARYSLTYGEGLDGYFVEPIFSGAIGFAVYNDRFFTPEYRHLPGVFDSWESLHREVPALVRAMDQVRFEKIQEQQFAAAAKNYNLPEYQANLRRYYEKIAAAW